MELTEGATPNEVNEPANPLSVPEFNNNESAFVSGGDKLVGEPPNEDQRFEELRKNLHRVWELETEEKVRKLTNSYYSAIRSAREKRAEALLMDNLLRLGNGQYQTKLLWSTDRRPHNNYEAACKAYLDWERRLESDIRLRKAFHVAISNWITNEYLENTVNDAECLKKFLTTFMVLKEQGWETKARLVVNGA